MKKINLTKKAILPAIIAVICSVVALTSVSYAWFSLGDSATVETINVNVVATDSIQISADGSKYSGILSVNDLKASALTRNQFPATSIAPMSTAGNVDADGFLEMFKGTIDEADSSKITTVKQAEGDTEKNFIAFDIYVKLDEINVFQLAAGSSVVLNSSSTVNSHVAARVGFIVLGNVADETQIDTLTGDTYTVPTDAKAVIWEPNSTIHVDKAGAIDDTNTAAQSYFGVSGASSSAFVANADGDYTDAVSTLKPAQDTDGKTSAAADLFELAAGVTKIRVYIWVEGQDADCINEIAGGLFDVNLMFSLTKPATSEPGENA